MTDTQGCCGGLPSQSESPKMLTYYERLHQNLQYYEKKVSDIKALINAIDNDAKFNEVMEQIEKVGLYI
jgi:hypothetical protein